MRDHLDQFLLLNPIFERLTKLKPQLIWPIHSKQRRHRCQTAVTLGKLRAFPNIAKKYAVR